MEFRLNINCDNAAFAEKCGGEVARLLRLAALEVEPGSKDGCFGCCGSLADINGNEVGSYMFTSLGDENDRDEEDFCDDPYCIYCRW